jgi:Na+/H+ antiporter NhaD/arsenite permease-like protein
MSIHVAADMSGALPKPSRRIGPLGWAAVGVGALAVGLLVLLSLAGHETGHAPHAELPPWWAAGVLPFVAVLGCIAVLPLLPATRHWWESNQNKLALSLAASLLAIVYYMPARGAGSVPAMLEHAIAREYFPFMVLLFALYVISGGISLRGDLAATPRTNTAFLALGAAIASVVGTTGASMVLIRPLLQTNAERRHVTHTVVFFIFLVSNVGGCLLPIGDPPLFLGYLLGVPFFWTLGLWPAWLVCCGVLLAVYFAWDTVAWRRERWSDLVRDRFQRQPLRVQGWSNIPLLAAAVACVAFVNPHRPLPGTDLYPFPFMRELIMLALVGASLRVTPREARESNAFNYTAILEVAALFAGIFVTMQVPIECLNARGSSLGIDTPAGFFWATGALSSFLDNAPTYVVFLETARSLPTPPGTEMLQLAAGAPVAVPLLVAVSLGAVFMGAMTYIGNGPNFMVKSIAEQAGVRMPSFFGYLFRYAIPVLIPLFGLVTLLFLLPSAPPS